MFWDITLFFILFVITINTIALIFTLSSTKDGTTFVNQKTK